MELARKNAKVIIACRTLSKGEQAIAEIKSEIGNQAELEVLQLDLADYNSIRNLSKVFLSKYNRLDILMNNAGIVNQIEKGTTKDGSETQMGTNHFGHFLLTGLLAETLMKTPQAREVTMSSGAYKQANINFEDLNWEKRPYHRVKFYGDSKLANLLFTMKLHQFFEAKNTDTIAVSAHPGLSASPRQQAVGIGGKLSKWLASPLERDSRSQLLAATAPFVKGNDFYGPKYGIDGKPVKLEVKHKQYTQEFADKLWEVSEKQTKFSFEVPL